MASYSGVKGEGPAWVPGRGLDFQTCLFHGDVSQMWQLLPRHRAPAETRCVLVWTLRAASNTVQSVRCGASPCCEPSPGRWALGASGTVRLHTTQSVPCLFRLQLTCPVWARVYSRVHVHVCVLTCVCTCVRMHVCVCVCAPVCMRGTASLGLAAPSRRLTRPFFSRLLLSLQWIQLVLFAALAVKQFCPQH